MKLSMEDHGELIDEAQRREDFDYEEELLIDDDDLEYNFESDDELTRLPIGWVMMIVCMTMVKKKKKKQKKYN